ncbi:MAG TPA: M3 family oligoendopeptidase [Candidatus Edwardsbacteria bacterium]|nr:M3 family oligoendopeptidase [Candidatus Edwardsbacteria bacterium]
MFSSLPKDAKNLLSWPWAEIEPYYKDLEQRTLTANNVDAWMADWSTIYSLVDEVHNRLNVATSVDTADAASKDLLNTFIDTVQPQWKQAEQRLKRKLLASGLCPRGCVQQLKQMRVEADLFREQNLPLLAQEQKLRQTFSAITGSQTVQWDGRELTVTQLKPVLQEQDRAVRERAWHTAAQRQLQDRGKLNDLWKEYFTLRQQIAANAGLPSFREYRWRSLLRFDYTPRDCETFRDAIEQAVVPAAAELHRKRAKKLGLPALRPWDLSVDPDNQPALRPFKDMAELTGKTARLFRDMDPALAKHFDTMVADRLLDLDNRANKRPGGYCTMFAAARRPFIFANAVGVHDDVQTLLHESGHAFHAFESDALPYAQQADAPMEFAEVASMGMELLASPHLEAFYDRRDAARALIEHLEGIILFWPYMAVVDGFQHWAYANPGPALDPAQCDTEWLRLARRFEAGVDWSGLDDVRMTGWHRKLHIFIHPFYYVEYGLAQLGAVQVWGKSLRDKSSALAAYRAALALGGTRPLPELFAAAGARFACDAATLRQAVALISGQLAELEPLAR